VLELVEGPTLAEKLASQRPKGIGLDEVLAIARQIADALDAAHERGIVHRDLKPANIAVSPDGVVKVLDFGLAKPGAGEERGELTNSPTMMAPTVEGRLLGTAPYMSPEQARGKAVDKRTDIWAFGCVLYEMLTGRRAFDGETSSDDRRDPRTRTRLLAPRCSYAAALRAPDGADARQGSENAAPRHRRRTRRV
jgi:eukaryotic-like serine/threonine-protein kinase